MNNLDNSNNKIIIISSPSGAGKTTICKYLLKKIDNVKLSISYTTRHKRINEIHGKDYYFINKEKFFTLINKNFFIEFARVWPSSGRPNVLDSLQWIISGCYCYGIKDFEKSDISVIL